MLDSSDSASELTSNVDSDEEPVGLAVKFTTFGNISDQEEVSSEGAHDNGFQQVTSTMKKKQNKTKTKPKKKT